ncbi:MAG: PhnD/SsuA/transferrin family substrate-binding protein [Erysipelotrichaceae bacterium]|jgi:phosphonate transport system substrate-binding protein
MKKGLTLLIVLIFLQACQVILPTKVETLNIVISPNISEETFLKYENEFSSVLKSELLNNGYDVNELNIQLATSNIQATEMIITQVADIGFLTKLSYFENRDSNLEVLLSQLDYSYNLETDDINIWNDKAQLESSKSLLDRHYAGIYLGSSPKGQELYAKFNQGESLTWIDLNSAKWCHVLVTSQEGYIYPSLWLIDNYSRRIAELFSHERVVKGYPELMLKLANQECDIVVGPDTLREEYESVWTKSIEQDGFNRSASIYNEVKLIALTSPILHDPVVYSSLNEKLDEGFVNAIKNSLINVSSSELKNPLLEAMDVKGFVESNNEAYDSFKPAYDYLNSIFN